MVRNIEVGTRILDDKGRRVATGPRNDPEGNARKPNAKQAARLEARQSLVPVSGTYPTGMKSSFFHKPGSQNRKK